jgi:hypothetical protein
MLQLHPKPFCSNTGQHYNTQGPVAMSVQTQVHILLELTPQHSIHSPSGNSCGCH